MTLLKVSKRLFVLFILWFAIHCIVISYEGLSDNYPAHADCILILGNKVNEDGTLSPRLLARCQKGLELYQKGVAPMIIVSGGFGKEGYWEGDKMRNFLVQHHVPDAAIIIDNKGIDTYSTALNYQKIRADKNLHSVVVVSQFSHLSRTKYILQKTGAENISHAYAEYFSSKDIYHLVREFFAWYAYLFKGKG